MVKKASKRSKRTVVVTKTLFDESKLLSSVNMSCVLTQHACGDPNCSYKDKPFVDLTFGVQVDHNEAIDLSEWLNKNKRIKEPFTYLIILKMMPIKIKGALTNAQQLE